MADMIVLQVLHENMMHIVPQFSLVLQTAKAFVRTLSALLSFVQTRCCRCSDIEPAPPLPILPPLPPGKCDLSHHHPGPATGMALQRIEENRYDVEAWTQLMKENQLKRIDDVRPHYEKLVETFPLSGRFWKIYIEHEMKSRNLDKVEKLFGRCLNKVLNIDLWKCYLSYIRETKGNLTSFKEKMAKAYDYALEHIGIDNLSYPIWAEYVSFLKNVDATGSYAENQKITATRKIYQRGIVNPMSNIEQFWKDYVHYEQSINAIIADKMTNDRAKEYMKARQVANEYHAVTRGLNRNAAAVPPTGSAEELRQVDGWRRFIAWEKSNPLKCEDEGEVVRRVVFAYEQSLLCMAHHPDIWYEYASFLEEHARSLGEKADSAKKFNDDAAAVFERATTTLLKSNILLHVAYADFEEGRNRKVKATEIYEKLLQEAGLTDPTLVYVHYMRYIRRSEGMKNFRAIFKKAREDTRTGHQAYTASALIEYYCHKDRNVATKIFELGLKRYPAAVDFILAYIEYQKTSNEENNTRVLFERVLTSGLEGERAIEVWNKFLEFEANVGDLVSITKVEKRRSAAVLKSNESRTVTSWLVDRYKFMDLMPCTTAELRSIGYESKAAASAGSSLSNGFSNKRSNGDANVRSENSRKKVIRPDVRQMLPFKPVYPSHLVPGVQGVPSTVRGGCFPPPPAVAALLSSLPHPSCFRGPFVSIDELMGILIMNEHIRDPSQVLKMKGVENGHGLFETALKAAAGRNSPLVAGDRKIKREIDEEDEADDNSNSGLNPGTDIYRSRKIKNAKMNL